MDVFDDVQPQQKKVDLDPTFGNFIHDHDGKDNEHTYENES
jgi:hypothetical protein